MGLKALENRRFLTFDHFKTVKTVIALRNLSKISTFDDSVLIIKNGNEFINRVVKFTKPFMNKQ